MLDIIEVPFRYQAGDQMYKFAVINFYRKLPKTTILRNISIYDSLLLLEESVWNILGKGLGMSLLNMFSRAEKPPILLW